MRNTRVFEISTMFVIMALFSVMNSNVGATSEEEGCGFSDPNPDSFELDQLCEELNYNPECFSDNGTLSASCAEELERKGSQEYENYKAYLNSTHNCTK